MAQDDIRKDKEIRRDQDVEFIDDRPYGEKSRYDPELEIPDPEQVKRDIDEVEKVYREGEQRKKPAA